MRTSPMNHQRFHHGVTGVRREKLHHIRDHTLAKLMEKGVGSEKHSVIRLAKVKMWNLGRKGWVLLFVIFWLPMSSSPSLSFSSLSPCSSFFFFSFFFVFFFIFFVIFFLVISEGAYRPPGSLLLRLILCHFRHEIGSCFAASDVFRKRCLAVGFLLLEAGWWQQAAPAAAATSSASSSQN